MKFVDMRTFLGLPPGILYTTYDHPELISLSTVAPKFGSLFIKGVSARDEDETSWKFTRVVPSYGGFDELDVMAGIRFGEESPDLDYSDQEVSTPADINGEIVVLERRDVEAVITTLTNCLAAYSSDLDYGEAPAHQKRIEDTAEEMVSRYWEECLGFDPRSGFGG